MMAAKVAGLRGSDFHAELGRGLREDLLPVCCQVRNIRETDHRAIAKETVLTKVRDAATGCGEIHKATRSRHRSVQQASSYYNNPTRRSDRAARML